MRPTAALLYLASTAVFLAACSDDSASGDAGARDLGAAQDGGDLDGSRPDTGTPVDSGSADTGTIIDTGVIFDSGIVDGGARDSGVVDTGTSDTGTSDTGTSGTGTDAGVPDTGADAGTPDTGADAGAPDTGASDAGGTRLPFTPGFCPATPTAPGLYQGTLAGNLNDITTTSCLGNTPGRDGAVRVEVPPGGTVVATYVSSGDGMLYILDSCPVTSSCLVGSDSGSDGDPETVSWTNNTSVTNPVYVVLDNFSLAGSGGFTLDLFLQ